MELLHLSTDMKNCFTERNSFRWEFSSLEFERNSFVALSSVTIDLKSQNTNKQPLRIILSLIDRNVNNPDGVLHCLSSKYTKVSYSSPILEYWKMDAVRPRSIRVTLPDHNTDNVSFMSLVLSIKSQW